MGKFIYTQILVIYSNILFAQNMHIMIGAGLMNYQGDLQSKKLTFNQSHPCVGIGAYYEVSDKLFVRANIIYGKVSAADSYSKVNYGRNLSFSSPITEFHLGLEYDIINSYQHSITPYVFAAVAVFNFNPSTIDATGKKVYLQPLGTEGQGFYNNRKKYSLTQLAIPFGGGLKYAVNDNVYIRMEAGFRKLFTDYLDDVSTFYIDSTNLLINNGPQAVALAFRGGERNPAYPYPAEGTIRGNPKSKDFYYTGMFSISFRLQSKTNTGRKGKSNVGCPVNVY